MAGFNHQVFAMFGLNSDTYLTTNNLIQIKHLFTNCWPMEESCRYREHKNKGNNQQNFGINRFNEPARNQGLISIISCLYYIKRVMEPLRPI